MKLTKDDIREDEILLPGIKTTKIYCELENDKFKGFHHLLEKPNDNYFEISKDEFETLLGIGEIYYNPKDKKLKSLYLESGSTLIKPKIDCINDKFVESATEQDVIIYLENKIQKLKTRIIDINNQLDSLRKAGLDGDIDYYKLEKELEITRQEYLNLNHELASTIDKNI